MNPFKGGSGRGSTGSGKTTRGGQAAGSSGRPSRGGRLRSLLGSGRSGGGSSSAGRTPGSGSSTKGHGRRGSGSQGKSGSTTGGSRWSRSPANPATWIGPRRAAAKSEREAEKKAKSKKSDKGAESTTGRKRRWPWSKKRNATDPDVAKDNDTKPEDEKKPKASKKASAKGAAADPKKPSDTPQAKEDDQATDADKKLKELADAKARPKTAAEKLKEMADARTRSTGTQPKPQKQGTVKTFDDTDFTTYPDPQWKPAPRLTPRPLNVDDQGFISPATVKPTKVKAPKGTNNTQRKSTMTDRTANPYVEQIDASTPETFRATALEAAKKLQEDANTKEQEAADLRRQAAALEGDGLPDAAEALVREAVGLEQDVNKRRQAAAAYERV